MKPTAQTVDEAIAGLDDDLQPITAPSEDDKPKTDEVVPDKPEPAEDPGKEKTPKDDEEGFTADEVEEAKTPEDTPAKPAEASEIDTSGLTLEQKYIVDNLPYITARIKDGDSVKDIQVKSWTQLPEDVQFASKRDEMAFMNSLTAQENRAQGLLSKFQQDQQNVQAQEFEQKENEAIREDIAELQKAGELPKFKVRADDPKFADDPATKEVQKVMDYMTERNEQYLKEYQQGRPYRHIGFREAYSMHGRANPPKSPQEVAEDKERKGIANKTNSNRGLAARELKRPTVKAGTRTEDILARIDAEKW